MRAAAEQRGGQRARAAVRRRCRRAARDASNGSDVDHAACRPALPSTRRWPPAMKTPSCRRRPRWSSPARARSGRRRGGRAGRAGRSASGRCRCAAAICWFTCGDARGQPLTLRDRGSAGPGDAGLQAVELLRRRRRSAPRRPAARASTTWRVDGVLRAAGQVDHRVEELRRRHSPGRTRRAGTRFSSRLELLEARAVDRPASDDARAASRVRKASCERVTVATSTPLPKKPAPVNWPVRGRQLGLLARVAVGVGVGDVVAGGLQRGVVREHRARADRHQGGSAHAVLQPSGHARAAGAAWC